MKNKGIKSGSDRNTVFWTKKDADSIRRRSCGSAEEEHIFEMKHSDVEEREANLELCAETGADCEERNCGRTGTQRKKKMGRRNRFMNHIVIPWGKVTRCAKRALAVLLAVVLVFGMMPTSLLAQAASTDSADSVSVSDDYISVTVSKENGGFLIDTIEGNKLIKSDNNKYLLYPSADYDTSYTSFRVTRTDGTTEDYIFGRDYGFLGLDSSDVTVETSGTTVTATWSVKDITVVQTLALLDESASLHGMVSVGYTFTSTKDDIADIKVRILYDTALGYQDYAVYEIPDAYGNYTYVRNETLLTGDDIYSGTMFAVDSLTSTAVTAYTVDTSVDGETISPYQVAIGHWNNLASTVFDYFPDASLNFTNAYNADYMTADSAYALYYELGALGSDASLTVNTYYGIYSNSTVSAEDGVAINYTELPTSMTLKTADDAATEDGSADSSTDSGSAVDGTSAEDSDSTASASAAYVSQVEGGADGDIRLGLQIENITSETIDEMTVVVKMQNYVCAYEDYYGLNNSGDGILLDEAEDFTTIVREFGAGATEQVEIYFNVTPQASSEYRKFEILCYNAADGEELTQEKLLGSREFYVLCPGTLGETISFSSMSPDIIYTEGTRNLYITGQNFMLLADTTAYTTVLHSLAGGDDITVPATNVVVDEGKNTIQLVIDQDMTPGSYQVIFQWNDISKEDTTSEILRFLVTEEEEYIEPTYGIVTIEKASNYTDENPAYKLAAYLDEAAYAKAQAKMDDPYDQILLEFRGSFSLIYEGNQLVEARATSLKDVEGHVLSTITISGCLDVEDGYVDILVNDAGTANQSIETNIDGKVYTSGSRTSVWSGVCALTTIENGDEVALLGYDYWGQRDDSDATAITLLWPGAASAIQTIAGMVMCFNYCQFGIMDEDEEGEEKQRVISFGAQVSLDFLIPNNFDWSERNTSTMEVIQLKMAKSNYTADQLRDVEERYRMDQEAWEAAEGGSATIYIQDILFGNGFIGLHASVSVGLPSYANGLPSLEGELDLSVVPVRNAWAMAVAGSMDFEVLQMEASLSIKSYNGIPIPDSLYLYIGGFTPGINIDGMGIFWIQGLGGGISEMYDTFFVSSYIPPITLSLRGDFSLFTLLDASARMNFSLRGFDLGMYDVSLMGINLLDSVSLSSWWYPEMYLSASMEMSILDMIEGMGYLLLEEDDDGGIFWEGFAKVQLTTPSLPLIGKIKIASAELGINAAKIWGALSVLFLNLSVTYYWGGDVDVALGSDASSGSMQAGSDAIAVYTDEETGDVLYMELGENVSLAAEAAALTLVQKDTVAEEVEAAMLLAATSAAGVSTTSTAVMSATTEVDASATMSADAVSAADAVDADAAEISDMTGGSYTAAADVTSSESTTEDGTNSNGSDAASTASETNAADGVYLISDMPGISATALDSVRTTMLAQTKTITLSETPQITSSTDRTSHRIELGTWSDSSDLALSVIFSAENEEAAEAIVYGEGDGRYGAAFQLVNEEGISYPLVWYDAEDDLMSEANQTANALMYYDETTGKAEVTVSFTEEDYYSHAWYLTMGGTAAELALYSFEHLPEISEAAWTASAVEEDDETGTAEEGATEGGTTEDGTVEDGTTEGGTAGDGESAGDTVYTGNTEITVSYSGYQLANIGDAAIYAESADGELYVLHNIDNSNGMTLSDGSDDDDGKVTFTVPSDLPGGDYTLILAATDADYSVSNWIEMDGTFTWVNENQPEAAVISSIATGGDYTLDVTVTQDGDIAYDGYLVTIYEQTEDEDGNTVWVESDIADQWIEADDSDENGGQLLTVGGQYAYVYEETEEDTGEESADTVTVTTETLGLTAGTTYRVGVKAYAVGQNANGEEEWYYSAETYSDAILMSEPNPATLTIEAVGKVQTTDALYMEETGDSEQIADETMDTVPASAVLADGGIAVTITSDQVISGTWSLDSGTETGDWTVDTAGGSTTITLYGRAESEDYLADGTLAEGEHILVVSGTNEAGDTVRETYRFRVDLTAPKLLISSPTNGAFFTQMTDGSGEVYRGTTVTGISDVNAAVYVVANGVTYQATVDADGAFSVDIPLDRTELEQSITVYAIDEAGNQSRSYTMTLINDILGDPDARLSIYVGDTDYTGEALPANTDGTELSLYVETDGESVEIPADSSVGRQVVWDTYLVQGTASVEGQTLVASGAIGMLTATLDRMEAAAVLEDSYTVTLPDEAERIGYTLTVEQPADGGTVEYNGNYKFTLTLTDGYSAGSAFSVKANGMELVNVDAADEENSGSDSGDETGGDTGSGDETGESESGDDASSSGTGDETESSSGTRTYTFVITNITENIEITIEGISDTTVPDLYIEIKDRESVWNTFLNGITFGLFFNQKQTVTITAADAGSGVADGSISYYLSEKELMADEITSEDIEWISYTEAFEIRPDNEYIIYAKASDNSGNTVYVNSDGIVLDATVPAITGIADGAVYCEAVTVSVQETYVDRVTVNGVEAELSESGTFTLNPADGTQTVVVTDKAGNSTSTTVTVNGSHTLKYAVSETDENVLVETCTYCDHEATATITASDAVYTGEALETASVSYSDGWQGGELAITYADNINAGTATASITAGDNVPDTADGTTDGMTDDAADGMADGMTGDAADSTADTAAGNTADVTSGTAAGITAHVTFTIRKASQNAPTLATDENPDGISAAGETIEGKADGSITGVTTDMEYRAEGETEYTAVTGETLENLADGIYYIRYAGDDNHEPSVDVTVSVGSGAKLVITFVVDGATYTTRQVSWGGSIAEDDLPAIPSKTGYDQTAPTWDTTDLTNITEDTTVTAIYTVNTYTVTLTDGSGYTLATADGSSETVEYQGSYSFILTLVDGYSKTEAFAVKVNGEKVEAAEDDAVDVGSTTEGADSATDGSGNTTDGADDASGETAADVTGDTSAESPAEMLYTITDVATDLVITVEGIADVTAPEATITLGTNRWNTFLNTITFGLFFNETQTVEITAEDVNTGSGVDKIYYFLSTESMTEEEVLAITEWTEYTGKFSIDPDNSYVIYVKATDYAGNATYVSSDGLVLDATAATIVGIEDGQTYYGDTSFTVVEANLDGVTLDGEVMAAEDGVYTIPADNQEHTIVVNDKAGNTVTYTVTVYEIYTVTYMVDGVAISKLQVNYGENVDEADVPEIPAKTGYDQTAPTWDHDGTNITADTTINAVYTINIYTVTYKADGEVVATATVEHGSDVNETEVPEIPAKTGYDQTAPTWDHDGTNITEDTTINAVYTINTYTVTYMVDEEIAATVTVEHGSDVDEAEVPELPVKEGYDQVAPTWDHDGTNIIADTTIHAVYTINTYEVTYKADGEIVATVTVEHGSDMDETEVPEIPAKTGYDQTAPMWDHDGTNITSDTEINAVYTINTYTVTYMVDGEVVAILTVEHGSDVDETEVPEIPEKEGYDQSALTWDHDGTNITADTTINAVYAINTYTVTYKADGETVATVTVEHGSDVKETEVPEIPAKEGYDQTEPTWDHDGSNITADTTINAVYTINTYTVTYKVDGETVVVLTVEHGSDVNEEEVPEIPAKTGYDQTAPTWDYDGTNITADTTINAVYTTNTYTVTYKADGEVVATVSVEHGSDVNATEVPEIPAKTGYDRTEPTWDHDGTNITADITINAVYTINSYTVTLVEGSGYVLKTAEGSSETVKYQESYSFTLTVADGYRKTEAFVVKVNGEKVEATEDAADDADSATDDASGEAANVLYTITNVDTDLVITVEGIADVTAPEATITLGTNRWNTFLNTITFGLFFNETQTVEITAEDVNTGSGVDKIYYFLSTESMTEEEVLAITEWTEYTGKFSIDPDNNYVIYVKATDCAGNATYVSSDGLVLDATAATIAGIEDGQTYYGDASFTVVEANLDGVTLDGEVMATEDGVYTIPADNQEHTIVVTDKAGNTVTYTVTVYEIYTVTYMADGVAISKLQVNYGEDVGEADVPEIPAKIGYDQTVPIWDHDGTNITADTTISAVYTINTYTVTYKADGEIVATLTVEHGSDVDETEVPEIPAKEGYDQTVPEWDHDGTNITADTTISAVYMINTYTVTYKVDGETVATLTVEHGSDVDETEVPEIPEKEGYDQSALTWDHDGTNITEDTTINAVYAINTYTVTYKVDGEIVATVTVEHGSDVKETEVPEIPAKEGYDQTEPTWDHDGTNITADTEINAVYTINTYTVTYKADGETVVTMTVDHGSDVDETEIPEIPAKTGYDQTAPAWDHDGTNITADTTINAVYTINTYTVIYKADGETVVTMTVEHGSDVDTTEIPEIPAKTGYDQTAPTWDHDGTNITADTTINAVYTINTYTVTYKVDGETVAMLTVEHGNDVNEEEVPEIPAKTGYDQTAPMWDYDGTNITADTTINAVYTINTYTVTLTVGSGYVLMPAEGSSETVNYQESYSFTLTVADGYSKTEAFAVKVNGEKVEATEDDAADTDSATDDASGETANVLYTITDVDTDLVITVEGIADVTAPEAEITLGTNRWNTFLNTITFGLFFNETQTVEITAEDVNTGSGVDKIYYYLATEAMTKEEVCEITDWTEYAGKFSIDPDNNYVIYVKAVDNAGNVAYVSSDGIVLDATPAVSAELESGQTYYGDTSFTLEDENLESVTLDGVEMTEEDGVYIIPADNQEHTVVIIDKAGNVATYTVTVYAIYTVTYVADGVVISTQQVNYGESVNEADVPEIPAKEGHDQTAPTWDHDGRNITSDTEIHAIYTINTYAVTIPEDQVGYTLTVDKSVAEWHEDVTLEFKLAEGYAETEEFTVMVNGVAVELVDGKFTIQATEADLIITVCGIEKETEEPTTEEPTTEEPTTEEPTTEEPTTEEPTTEKPTMEEPTTGEITTESSTSEEETNTTVDQAEATATETTANGGNSSKTADTDMVYVWIVVLLGATMITAFLSKKKKAQD